MQTQQQALQTLINAAQVATKRGAFELAETEVILQAVKMFTDTSKNAQEPQGEEKQVEPSKDAKKKPKKEC